MGNAATTVRRRRAGEATRRRVLDAVVTTVVEVGYYKASSNEIARRAGVTWGAIQHLFGSREQMMLEVANDIRTRFEQRLATAQIDGASLEERLDGVLDVLSEYYEYPEYLVQVQIQLDLSVNPGMSAKEHAAIRRTVIEEFTATSRPLFVQALGAAADEEDLVAFACATFVGHLASHAIARLAADLPDISITRDLLVRSVAMTIRDEMARRGLPTN